MPVTAALLGGRPSYLSNRLSSMSTTLGPTPQVHDAGCCRTPPDRLRPKRQPAARLRQHNHLGGRPRQGYRRRLSLWARRAIHLRMVIVRRSRPAPTRPGEPTVHPSCGTSKLPSHADTGGAPDGEAVSPTYSGTSWPPASSTRRPFCVLNGVLPAPPRSCRWTLSPTDSPVRSAAL